MFRDELKFVPIYIPGKPIKETIKEYGLEKKEVIKLASNENPLGPSPLALKSITDNLDKIHLYPENDSQDLRISLSEKLGLNTNEIIIGRGSDEVIQILSKAVLNKGDEIIVSQPTFSVYEIAGIIMGACIQKVPLKEDLTQDLDGILEKISNKTKLIYLTNPHNPTGSLNKKNDVEKFLEKIPKNIFVVMDEAYCEYVECKDYPDSITFMRGKYKNVIGMRTFSKIYGLAGLRLGYGFSLNPELISAMYKVKEPFNVSNLAQFAGTASLTDADQVIRSRELNSAGKIYLTENLKDIGLTPYKTESNFILVNTDRAVKPLTESLLKRGMIIRNCTSFGLETCFRVTISTFEDNVKLIDLLKDIIVKNEW